MKKIIVGRERFVKWFDKLFNKYIEEDIGEINNLYYCSPSVIYDLLKEEHKMIVDAPSLEKLKQHIEKFPEKSLEYFIDVPILEFHTNEIKKWFEELERMIK